MKTTFLFTSTIINTPLFKVSKDTTNSWGGYNRHLNFFRYDSYCITLLHVFIVSLNGLNKDRYATHKKTTNWLFDGLIVVISYFQNKLTMTLLSLNHYTNTTNDHNRAIL